MKKRTMFWLIVVMLLAVFGIADSLKHSKNTNEPKSSPSSRQAGLEKSGGLNNQPKILEDIHFPKDFFFGTAYSDFQTAGLSPASDWAKEWDKIANMVEKDSLVKNQIRRKALHPGVANDFFNRYKEDIDLAAQFGDQVHRISLDWARIEPEEGKYNMEVVRKWIEVFRYAELRGVKIMICLNHFPHPTWFAKKGGWENSEAPYYYARYAEFLAENIGVPLQIKWWLTFNEPQFVILVPYAKGSWPPFKEVRDLGDQDGMNRLALVASHVLDGHRLSYRAIHKVMDMHTNKDNKAMVGFASATGAFYPYDSNSSLDQIASNTLNTLYGTLLDYSIGSVDRDFVGLNYYGRVKLRFHISLWNAMKSWLTEERPFAIEWVNEHSNQPNARPKEFYPRALYDLIMKFKALNKPIIITENGLDDDADKFREEFIIVHLKAIHDAIRDGADVIGYQYWALADTWEPGDATFSHMGLIRIDRENRTLNRSLRPSAKTYGEIIRTKTIRKELLNKYGN